jgi:hypothetical protein
MNTHKNKDNLLGEPFGTATGKLRKMILFKLIQAQELDMCYRCSNKIESIDDLSIEHKDAWQSSDNPVEAFYDLNNIAFSHLDCNKRAQIHKKGPEDPSLHNLSRYRHHKCRCSICVDAQRKYKQERK